VLNRILISKTVPELARSSWVVDSRSWVEDTVVLPLGKSPLNVSLPIPARSVSGLRWCRVRLDIKWKLPYARKDPDKGDDRQDVSHRQFQGASTNDPRDLAILDSSSSNYLLPTILLTASSS
jgi:hypothetical protein